MRGVDKILAPLMGRPLVSYSLEAFNESPLVDSIVVVASPKNLDALKRLCHEAGWCKVREVKEGGRRRRDSVRAGLEGLLDTEWTVVHDGARPLLEPEMIERGLEAARQTGAAVAAVPVADTIKRVTADHIVDATLDRDGLWAVQTPQAFRTEVLYEAHRADSKQATDDAALVERHGGAVRVFLGHPQNIKIATPDDLVIAEAIISSRATARPER